MSPRKNPAAVALGRRGGRANTPAQKAARGRNGRLGGAPRRYRLTPRYQGGVLTLPPILERREGDHWVTLTEPIDAAAKAFLRRHSMVIVTVAALE